MTWPTPLWNAIDLHTPGRIEAADAARQLSTAKEILRRLTLQPGAILADEVGMGKTFVALAVAASVARADKARRPVVVMVPSSLRDKWPRDFGVFCSLCLGSEEPLRTGLAKSGVEFFKLLDDPKKRRAHIIFLTHGALYRNLRDPWTKLAILRASMHHAKLGRDRRRAVRRFAGDILQAKKLLGDANLIKHLFQTHYAHWREVVKEYQDDPGDDPVPEAMAKVLSKGKVDLSELRHALDDIPLRTSSHIHSRLLKIRRSLNEVLQQVWREALVVAGFRSPLLILDEAHHLRNPATKLASLFVADEAEEDSNLLYGALKGRFERMLFLTATPFQLGHEELLNVLNRFAAIDWRSCGKKEAEQAFAHKRTDLAKKLEAAQIHATQFDHQWRVVKPDDLNGTGVDGWWTDVLANPQAHPDRVQTVKGYYDRAKGALEAAGDALRPSIIRHLRPCTLPKCDVIRRDVHPGDGISDGQGERGIEIADASVLPFLLAARSQVIVARSSGGHSQRATFAEGLASSYEAFLHTRALRDGDANPDDVVDEELLDGDGADDGRLNRYMRELRRALPKERAYATHPKIGALVRAVHDLWRQGEKVLVFCHYRETGKAAVRHISAALHQELVEGVAAKVGGADEAERLLESVSTSFDKGETLHRKLTAFTFDLLSKYPVLSDDQRELVSGVVRRFVRNRVFLARYWDFEQSNRSAALDSALSSRDRSGWTLAERLDGFAQFIAERCAETEREEYLEALDKLQTARAFVRDGDGEAGRQVSQMPNIALVNGGVQHETRRRRMLGFNTPFFPEILVASNVLAEGVDLHLNCRYIIHHDLCWNPSTLEQRTGRVDRIHAKAEQVEKPIHVYLPYVAGTQDEKMYRVVQDRQRWFQVVMGEKYAVDETSTDKLEERVPLPESVARELAFRLEV